jgi:transcriptional regulator with XRE-family HTH domain
VLQDTDLGPYLPREFGEKFRLRITLADAARLIGVTSSAIKHWRSGNPSLKAATLPGCESLDVDLPKLVEFAAEKYLTGAKFVKAGDVPSYIAYFQIRFLAERLHLDWRGLMDGIVTDAQTRALLLQPLSKLPQQVFRELQEHVKPFRNYAPSLTREGNFPPIYYSRLSESFYIGRKIVPAAAMIRLIQGCAAKTSHSPAYLYGLVRTLCKPAHLYPADFDSFKHRQQSIVGVTAFPLAAAVFLETVTTGEGICYYSTKLPKNVYNGDFIIFPDEHDFGVVTRVQGSGQGAVATVKRFVSKEMISVTVA